MTIKIMNAIDRYTYFSFLNVCGIGFRFAIKCSTNFWIPSSNEQYARGRREFQRAFWYQARYEEWSVRAGGCCDEHLRHWWWIHRDHRFESIQPRRPQRLPSPLSKSVRIVYIMFPPSLSYYDLLLIAPFFTWSELVLVIAHFCVLTCWYFWKTVSLKNVLGKDPLFQLARSLHI